MVMFPLFSRHDRSGTTVVETAFVLPVFLMFLFALIEFGHAQMVKNVINSACRTGARMGSTEGRSTADVEAHVRQVLGSLMDANDVSVYVKNASPFDTSPSPATDGESLESLPDIQLSEAEPRQLFVVRAKVEYNDIALVPMPFLSGVVLNGQAFMRHE
jgi:Flp pilus assembly protein TadG